MSLDWNPTTLYQDVAIAEHYDRERFSSLAGRVFNALEQREIRRAFRDVPRTANVLDLPSGTGRLAEPLLDEGFRVTGVDISDAMLTVAQRKLSRFGDRFRVRVADVNELAKDEPASFDVALCARVLMHFPLEGQIQFLRAVATLTKGPVIFSQSLSNPYHRFRRRMKHLIGNAAPAMYPLTETDLAALLQGAGLREVRRYRVARLISEAALIVAEHR